MVYDPSLSPRGPAPWVKSPEMAETADPKGSSALRAITFTPVIPVTPSALRMFPVMVPDDPGNPAAG